MTANSHTLQPVRKKRHKSKKKLTIRSLLKSSVSFLTSDYYDFNLLAVVILLTCFGLVMLYSTSSYMAEVNYGNDMFYFKKQALISTACLIGALFISKILDYHILLPFRPFLWRNFCPRAQATRRRPWKVRLLWWRRQKIKAAPERC